MPFDNAVTGTADFGSGPGFPTSTSCIKVTWLATSLCSFKLYGTIDAAFDETPQGTAPTWSQDLTLNGTLHIKAVQGFLCPVSNGDTVTFNVVLAVTTAGGLIDFVP